MNGKGSWWKHASLAVAFLVAACGGSSNAPAPAPAPAPGPVAGPVPVGVGGGLEVPSPGNPLFQSPNNGSIFASMAQSLSGPGMVTVQSEASMDYQFAPGPQGMTLSPAQNFTGQPIQFGSWQFIGNGMAFALIPTSYGGSAKDFRFQMQINLNGYSLFSTDAIALFECLDCPSEEIIRLPYQGRGASFQWFQIDLMRPGMYSPYPSGMPQLHADMKTGVLQ